MKQILEYALSYLRDLKLEILKRGTFIKVYYDMDLGDVPDCFPEEFLVQRVDKNTLEITPKDDLNETGTLLNKDESRILARMVYNVNLLNATISAVKKYSTTEPLIEFETDEDHFKYSFTVVGETYGEIFNTVIAMYKEIEQEVGPADIDFFIERFNNFL
jgi:hypothetical protein